MNIATVLCLAVLKAVEVFLWAKHVWAEVEISTLCVVCKSSVAMKNICGLLLSRSVMQLKSFFEFRPLQRA